MGDMSCCKKWSVLGSPLCKWWLAKLVGGWIRLIVGFQPLMVISPTAYWIRCWLSWTKCNGSFVTVMGLLCEWCNIYARYVAVLWQLWDYVSDVTFTYVMWQFCDSYGTAMSVMWYIRTLRGSFVTVMGLLCEWCNIYVRYVAVLWLLWDCHVSDVALILKTVTW